MSSYTALANKKKLLDQEVKIKESKNQDDLAKFLTDEDRDDYQPKLKDDVLKPKKEGKSVGDKIAIYEALTGQSALQPLRDLIDGPQAPNMTTPDLVSEVRNKIELQKQQIASAPKMYPMYYERAKKGKFIKVKTKLGRTRKTKLL